MRQFTETVQLISECGMSLIEETRDEICGKRQSETRGLTRRTDGMEHAHEQGKQQASVVAGL